MTCGAFPLMEYLVNTFEGAIVTPLAEVVIDGLPFGKVMGEESPGNTTHEDIEEGIDDFAQVCGAGTATRFSWGK